MNNDCVDEVDLDNLSPGVQRAVGCPHCPCSPSHSHAEVQSIWAGSEELWEATSQKNPKDAGHLLFPSPPHSLEEISYDGPSPFSILPPSLCLSRMNTEEWEGNY